MEAGVVELSCTGSCCFCSRARQLSLDVPHEHVREVVGEAAPDDDPERREVFTIRRERVRGHLPAALPQRVRDVEDRVVLDVGPERERKHRQLVPAGDQLEGPELGDLRRQVRRDVTRVAVDLLEPVEAEPEEVVVLGDDLGARPREVEGERRHVVPEVVDPEDQVLGQRRGIAPDDPADTGVDEPVLVPRRVDRGDARQAEVPHQLRVEERGDERPGRAVDVHGHVDARLAPGKRPAPCRSPPPARTTRRTSTPGSRRRRSCSRRRCATASAAARWKRSPSMGTRRISTSSFQEIIFTVVMA